MQGELNWFLLCAMCKVLLIFSASHAICDMCKSSGKTEHLTKFSFLFKFINNLFIYYKLQLHDSSKCYMLFFWLDKEGNGLEQIVT